MNRTRLLICIAALPLAACSGKAKDTKDTGPSTTTSGAAKEAHVNPWAKDAAPGSEPSAAAKDKAKAAPEKPAAKDAHANPWAKDPPPGSEPTDPAKDKSKPK